MRKRWLYRISFLCLILNFPQAFALSEDDISNLKGKDFIYSSPFEDGNKATKFKAENISLSTNFIDDGKLIINQHTYPIDQLFIKNNTGQYENLAYLLNYNGITTTLFIRYYDKERLSIKNEIAKLKEQTNNCINIYNGSGSNIIAKEANQQEKCLDKIFHRIVHLFYTKSEQQLLKDYNEQSALWTKLYFNAINPDNCINGCGTITQMQAYNKVAEAKQTFILDFLKTFELSID